MERIKKVGIASRRSSKVGQEFFTFEMSLEADLDGLSEGEKKEYIKNMWGYASSEVDKQLEEVANS